MSSFENPQEENLWTFHRRNETAYYIQNVKSGTYLCINGPQVTLEEDAYELLVETKDDTIMIRRGDYLLEADENRCITAATREEGGPKSHNRFRLFGAGREYTLTAEEEDYRITLNLSVPDACLTIRNLPPKKLPERKPKLMRERRRMHWASASRAFRGSFIWVLAKKFRMS